MRSISMRDLRTSLALGATALAITGAAATVVPETASAANATLRSGENANFPTWFFGNTTICAENTSSSYTAGRVTLAAFGSPAETFVVPPRGQGPACVTRGWWGFNVNAKNSGGPALRVYNLNGPN